MKDEKKSLLPDQEFNIKPIAGVDKAFGLYYGSQAKHCPWQTLHGIFASNGIPTGFVPQHCMTACALANVKEKPDGKIYYITHCSGQAVEYEVEMRDNSKIQTVPVILNP